MSWSSAGLTMNWAVAGTAEAIPPKKSNAAGRNCCRRRAVLRVVITRASPLSHAAQGAAAVKTTGIV